MTTTAAALARTEQKWVWVRDGEGQWTRGKIREIGEKGKALVDLDGTTVTVALDDIHETPPPGTGPDDGVNRLALIPVESGGALTPKAAAAAASPQVAHYYDLLVAFAEAERARRARELMRAVHPDRGGDVAEFQAIQIALDLIRNGAPPQPAEPLLLTHSELGLPLELDVPGVEPPVSDIGRELPGQPFSAIEIARLTALRQVGGPADLARLAGVGRPAADLIAIGGLRPVLTLDDLVVASGLRRPVADLAELAGLPLTTKMADLVALAVSPFATARLTALAVVRLATDRVTLLQLATLPLPEADIVHLAGLVQVATMPDLQLLAGLVGPRTVADVTAIAGIGSATFAAPSTAEIATLCALPKTAVQIVALSAAPGVADTGQLVALANQTRDRDTAGDAWWNLNKRWEAVEAGWATRWPLTATFAAMRAGWLAASQLVRSFVRDRANPASAADLQTFALAAAQMRSSLDLIDQIAPALDEGQQALTDADLRLADLARLLTEIDDELLPYYAGPSAARATVNTQRGLAIAAQAVLNAERNSLVADRANFALLPGLTPVLVGQAVAGQHTHLTNVAATQTAAMIGAPLAALRTADYQQRISYPNLRLTERQTGHAFWQSLQPVERARWNTKLAGYPVTAWAAVQGYPTTRDKQNGYAGAQILIPQLNNFPCQVSGEIVHDWVFDTQHHGHRASVMAGMLHKALNHQPHSVGMLTNLQPTQEVKGPRTVYGWQNVLVNIVVVHGGGLPTLITYYNPM